MPPAPSAFTRPQKSFTRDFNDEGMFILTDAPLMEGTIVHAVVSLPGRTAPLAVKGAVVHTVIVEDGDVPGMGLRFDCLLAEQVEMQAAYDELEDAFCHGKLPEEVIT